MTPLLLALAVLAAAAPAPGPRPAAGTLSGAASPLLPSFCVAAATPFDPTVLRCAGLIGTDVFLAGTEDDRHVALGAPAGFPPSLPRPSRLSRTLDWRLLGDRAVAAILRYDVAAEGPEPALRWIVVLKPGTPARPGCVVALLDGDADEGAAAAATRAADERAAGFRCGIDRPEVVGRAGDATRRLGTRWLAGRP